MRWTRRTGSKYLDSGVQLGAVVGVACALLNAVLAAQAEDSLCGATIVTDLKLDHDVACSGNGLIIGADGIRIDLNGYTLSGSRAGVGIGVTGRREITIWGGTVTNFAPAIRVNSSTDVDIKHINFANNTEGIDFQGGSVGNTVKENLFRDSTVRGVMLRADATDNDVKNNTFINDRVAILIFGGVDNTVKQNEISENTVAGIRLIGTATGNVLKDNAVATSAAGIEFVVTLTEWPQGNELKGNTLSANVCGLKGPTAGNTLKDNVFEGNAADTCS
jgi:large repetitive protein